MALAYSKRVNTLHEAKVSAKNDVGQEWGGKKQMKLTKRQDWQR